MELYIRSQDKMKLVSNCNLYISTEMKNEYIIEDLNNKYLKLGTYRSKERALEILDEIQNSILGILTLEDIEEQEVKEYTGKATFSKITNNLVYIMPEE